MTSNAQKYDQITRDIVALSKYLTPAQNRAIKASAGVAMTASINAAIASAISAGAASAWMQDGEWTLDGAGIVVTAPLILEGTGPTHCIIRQTSGTGGGVLFNYPVPSPGVSSQGGGLRGLTIEAGQGWQTNGNQGVGSTGVGVEVRYANDLFRADNISVNNFDYSIAVKGCFQTTWTDFRCLYYTRAGVQVDKYGSVTGAGNRFELGKISNNGFTGSASGSYGIHLIASGGDFFGTIDVTASGIGVLIQPTTGKQVAYCQFSTVLADTSVFDNWLVDATDGDIVSITCNGCWGAFSDGGAGLHTMGPNLDGFEWNGGNLRENGQQGWLHSDGINVWLDGVSIASNGKSSSNTYPGVQIAGNVSLWGITDCRIGNFASAFTTQAEGIVIGAGLSENFTILGNDLNDAGAGKSPIVNGSSLLNWTIGSNLPKLAAGNNSSDTTEVNGTATSVSSGTFARTLAGTSRLARTIRVEVAAAPTAGKSYIYTLWVDGVAQALTATIADSATSNAAAGSVLIPAGDLYELRLTSSGSPSATDHYWSIVCEA